LLSGIQIADLSAWTPAAIFVSNEGGRFSCGESTGGDAEVQQEKRTKAWALAGNTAKRRGFDQRLKG